MKRYDDALQSYDKAIKINPNHFFSHGNRGITLKDLNRYDEALNSYDRAIEINPNFVEAYNNKGNALKDLKRYEEALDNHPLLSLHLDFEVIYQHQEDCSFLQ